MVVTEEHSSGMWYHVIWHVGTDFFLLDCKNYTKKMAQAFVHPAITLYTSCLLIQQMDLLSLVLCSIFVQSLDFVLE
jgi:hypothetical protein